MLKKATTLAEIRHSFSPEPLTESDMAFHVDTDAGRGEVDYLSVLCDDLNSDIAKEKYSRIMFVGHRGMGKSTELNRLKTRISDNILCFSVVIPPSIIAINSLDYAGLAILIMEQVYIEALRFEEAGLLTGKVREKHIERIRQWANKEEFIRKQAQKYGLSLEAGVGTEGKAGAFGFWATFFGKLRGTYEIGGESLRTLKTDIEPEIPKLIQYCEEFLLTLHSIARQNKNKAIILIIEDLDKLRPGENTKELFQSGKLSALTELQASLLFTVPIDMYYDSILENGIFQGHPLPTIKVREKSGEIYPNGVGVLRQIIAKRMDITFFEDYDPDFDSTNEANFMGEKTPSALMDELILYSGGSMRDLFIMIKAAAQFARGEIGGKRTHIHTKAVRYAKNQLKADYVTALGTSAYTGISTDMLIAEAQKVVQNTSKDLLAVSPALRDLYRTTSVMRYNGENWIDLHPAVREYLTDRNLI